MESDRDLFLRGAMCHMCEVGREMRGPVQVLRSKLFSSVKDSTLVANWSSLKGQKTSGIRSVSQTRFY